jgi:TPP-dependent pyruvate/acetoin dehydrogenase alpha subunit
MSTVRSERTLRRKASPEGRHATRRRSPVAPEDYLLMYERMLKVYYVEERIKAFVHADKCSFHASSRGKGIPRAKAAT